MEIVLKSWMIILSTPVDLREEKNVNSIILHNMILERRR